MLCVNAALNLEFRQAGRVNKKLFTQGTLRKGITFKHKLSYSNYFGFR